MPETTQEKTEAARHLSQTLTRFQNADEALRRAWSEDVGDHVVEVVADEYAEARREHQRAIEAYEQVAARR